MTSSTQPASRRKLWSSALVLTVAVGAGILLFPARSTADVQPQSAAPPAPEVHVETLASQQKRTWQTFSGRLAAVDQVAVRPRVGGMITEVLFEEGARVEQGRPLFVIDPRPFENELAAAKADLGSSRSRVDLAQQELQRLDGLLARKAVSKSLFDVAENDLKVAKASVRAAEARVKQAELNLEYAHIKAPVTGRISRAEITLGNLVEAGPGAPVLATIVADDRIYAEFDVDERTYISSAAATRSARLPVSVKLNSENDLSFDGYLLAFDNKLDPSSGTIRARALLENRDHLLVPGMYASVRLGSPSETSVLLVRDEAVATDQDKKYVYVIDDNNQITYRQVTLGRFIEGKREVKTGLNNGDRVLVNGLQRVRPGMPVQPVEAGNDLG
ncbi:efflux RND transporter periplasmic adaptor subunit [Acanthopleuribacter pedis]|uniref:Efflux RND transporter periplasmic adaptor subunit n=1 Tax=Acanthopleuribacter pedis TaxID=442870 RepID=A0A8J7QJM6_9BACT|nr:efflux RND transporter periplasmic adaptor subunit [Acanthopleuribacter pedis]MBO1321305.1 efflux RND transporter periplasmic adaptor subunit [Acanthopleuribacter pedis]